MNPTLALLTTCALSLAPACGGSQKPTPQPAPPPDIEAPTPEKVEKTVRPPDPDRVEPELLAELQGEDEYVLGGPVGVTGVVGGVPGGVVGGIIGGVEGYELDLMEAPPPPPPKPGSVPAAALLEHRIETPARVAPSPGERRAILRSKAGRASVSIELCLSARAEITSTALVGASSYPAWENALMEAMWEWRFRPYDATGTATAICSHLDFTFPEPESPQP